MPTFEKLKELALNQLIEQGQLQSFQYKYKPLNEYTFRILSDHELWFCRPSQLNDDFECTASILKAGSSEIRNWLIGLGLDKLYDFADLDNHLPEMATITRDAINRTLDNIGILSLSQFYDNQLMWSHYADSSKGICFGFDVLKDASLFGTTYKVEYKDEMYPYNHFTESVSDALIKHIICRKSSDWKYEGEARTIKMNSEMSCIGGTSWQNNGGVSFRYKPASLECIYLGERISNDNKSRILELCQTVDLSHVKIYEMKKKQQGAYGLIPCQIK